jgi:hypothetical protein
MSLEMKYFVLKPHGSDAYAKASRAAMREYATLIYGENPDLARDLRDWADREQFKATSSSRSTRIGQVGKTGNV